MNRLQNKKVLLGVTGGIAAYKAAELVRRLREAGAEVRVVMTAGAMKFVTPLTFQALSGHPVHSALLDPAAEAAMGHIQLARWADVVLVAPATANVLARLAHGLADDLLATLCLALPANTPLAVAPAMNQAMWARPATRANVETLRARGVHLFGPALGVQACGDVGVGRLLEVEDIVQALAGLFDRGVLAGCHVLITAGPTREAVDPVRFLSNRSSGKMGYALANAAAEAGARVTLVSGPVAGTVSQSLSEAVDCVTVESAAQMYAAVMARVAGQQVFIATAAVADYRPRRVAAHKLKKRAGAGELSHLELEPTEDIVAAVAALSEGRPFTVGFAAETERLEEHARAKLKDKGLDMVAANSVGGETGFDTDDNALQLFWPGGDQVLPRDSKPRLARCLVEIIAQRLAAGTRAADKESHADHSA